MRTACTQQPQSARYWREPIRVPVRPTLRWERLASLLETLEPLQLRSSSASHSLQHNTKRIWPPKLAIPLAQRATRTTLWFSKLPRPPLGHFLPIQPDVYWAIPSGTGTRNGNLPTHTMQTQTMSWILLNWTMNNVMKTGTRRRNLNSFISGWWRYNKQWGHVHPLHCNVRMDRVAFEPFTRPTAVLKDV